MTTTVVVGNPRPGSRTLAAAVQVAHDLSGSAPDHVLDLAVLGARLLDWQDAAVDEAADTVRTSHLVVVGSPTYKATYTGLLKLFLERFASDELVGVVGVPVLVGAAPQHSLAVETHLRPVLVEIGLSTPTRGLFLIDSDGATGAGYEGWLERARLQLASVGAVVA